MSAPLEVEGVSAGYGRGDIIQDVSLALGEGEIVTIIGPNGAGKSTVIKAIAGVVRPRTGSIRIRGVEIAGLAASEIARRGVGYVPQEANVFRQLTVRENLEMGAWIDRTRFAERLAFVHRLFPVLEARAGVRAGSLSGGERQMVAFGMALMVEPGILLLDEPSAGLAPAMVGQMFETVRSVNSAGIAVLMVEQNAVDALKLSHRGYVMAAGRMVMADQAARLIDSTEVAELYLGARQ